MKIYWLSFDDEGIKNYSIINDYTNEVINTIKNHFK